MRRSLLIMLVFVLLVTATTPAIFLGFRYLQAAAKARHSKEGLYAIQLALERYSVDLGAVPDDIQQLVARGYSKQFPINPYSGQTMVQRDPLAQPAYRGDFSYLPAYKDCFRRNGEVLHIRSGYFLFGYGVNKKLENPYLRDLGIRGVTLVLQSGNGYYGDNYNKEGLLCEDTEPLEAVLLRLTGYEVHRKAVTDQDSTEH